MSTNRKTAHKECVEELAIRQSGDVNVQLAWARDVFHGIFRGALLLVPVFAWNSLFIGAIDKVFPPEKRNGKNIGMRLVYALIVTCLVLLILLYTPI